MAVQRAAHEAAAARQPVEAGHARGVVGALQDGGGGLGPEVPDHDLVRRIAGGEELSRRRELQRADLALGALHHRLLGKPGVLDAEKEDVELVALHAERAALRLLDRDGHAVPRKAGHGRRAPRQGVGLRPRDGAPGEAVDVVLARRDQALRLLRVHPRSPHHELADLDGLADDLAALERHPPRAVVQGEDPHLGRALVAGRVREDVRHALADLDALRRPARGGDGDDAVGATLRQDAGGSVAGDARERALRAVDLRGQRDAPVLADGPDEQAAVEAGRDGGGRRRPGDADLHVLQCGLAHLRLADLSAGLAVPDADLLVTAGGHDPLAVGRPGRSPQAAGDLVRLRKLLHELALLALVEA
mmetsp:Transcript_27412/g.81641  ORF Transcript_27412/g.81641 Transcript_27412/m.81641 type:complete len:361 (+) Transcript_27412:231-1313(+)